MGNVDSHTLGKSSRRYSFKEIPCSLRVTRVRTGRNEGVHAELVQREIEPLDISQEHPQRLFWLLALATGAHQRCSQTNQVESRRKEASCKHKHT